MSVTSVDNQPSVRARRKRWLKRAERYLPGISVGWRGGRLYYLHDRTPVAVINRKGVPDIPKSGNTAGGFEEAEPGRNFERAQQPKAAPPKYAPQPTTTYGSGRSGPRSWKCEDCGEDNFSSDVECYNSTCPKKAPWLR